MYRSFSIENFRGITSLKLAQLSKVNVLTGLNDAGKTSVLEALFLHASGPQAGIAAIQTLLPSRRQELIALQPSKESPWRTFFHNFDTDHSIVFNATGSPAAYRVELKPDLKSSPFAVYSGEGRADNSATNASGLSIKVTPSKGMPKQYWQTILTQSTNLGAVGQNLTVQFQLDPENAPAKIPAVILKSGLAADLATAYSQYLLSPSSLNLLQALQIIDQRIEELQVLVVGGRAQLHARVNGVLTLFQLLGDGPNAMAQNFLAIATAKAGIVLIDEVGVGVHHSALPAMWHALIEASDQLGVQLFATTHSQESVLAAQSAIKKAHDLSVYRLSRPSANAGTEVTSYSGLVLEAAAELNAELR